MDIIDFKKYGITPQHIAIIFAWPDKQRGQGMYRKRKFGWLEKEISTWALIEPRLKAGESIDDLVLEIKFNRERLCGKLIQHGNNGRNTNYCQNNK